MAQKISISGMNYVFLKTFLKDLIKNTVSVEQNN